MVICIIKNKLKYKFIWGVWLKKNYISYNFMIFYFNWFVLILVFGLFSFGEKCFKIKY